MAEPGNFRALPPEDRIKRLKELEEERKKELEEMEKEIDSSEKELQLEEQVRQKVPVNQLRAVDVSQLQSEEERQLFAAHRGMTMSGMKGHEDESLGEHTKHARQGLEGLAEDTPEMTDKLQRALRESALYQNITAQKEAGGGVKYDITSAAHHDDSGGDSITEAYKAKTSSESYKAVTEQQDREKEVAHTKMYRTRGF